MLLCGYQEHFFGHPVTANRSVPFPVLIRSFGFVYDQKDSAFGVGDFLAVFDPLDGSKNIDASLPVGTIFGIYRKPTMSQQQLLSVASCASHDGVRRFLGGYWQGTRGNHRCRSQFWSLPDHNFVAKLSQQPMQRQQMSTGLKASDAVADGDFLLTNAAAYLFFIRNFRRIPLDLTRMVPN